MCELQEPGRDPALKVAASGCTPYSSLGLMRSALSRSGFLKRVGFAWLVLAALCQMALMREDKNDVSIQGKLLVVSGKPSMLESAGKSTRLTSDVESIAETLLDPRLSGRELKLVGKRKSDGSFEVRDFFVAHGDRLFRLIYFCDTCNITTFSPGICLCCQQPTVPMEVPLTDHRVYQEEIKPGPPE